VAVGEPFHIGWAQPIVATPACWRDSSCSLRASAGVFQRSVFRGLLLSAAATASISRAFQRDRSVSTGCAPAGGRSPDRRAPVRPRPARQRPAEHAPKAAGPWPCSRSAERSADHVQTARGRPARPRTDPDLVDEGHYQGSRGSSFPAKNEEAASRISFAPGKRTRRKADTAPRVDLTSASTLSTRSAAGFARYLDVGS
jgi:hypothetical protein